MAMDMEMERDEDIDMDGHGHARMTASTSTALRQLADAIYADRQAGSDVGAHLSLALAQFARARTASRTSANINRNDKLAVSETRNTLDAVHLAAQNKKYEINHLYREILKCNDYDSIYQDLPLSGEEEYLASDDDAPTDEHERMVARLRYEVSERQRAQADLKALLASKTKVIKETEIRKASLEQLEKQLDDFVASAKAIQAKFASMS